MLHNLAIDHYRWWARRPEISAPDLPAPALDNPADAADRRIDLAAALARLTPRQRALLICRFYEDLTETQAAQALGISPNTDKSQTRRALDEHLRLGRGSELGGVAGPGCRRAGPALRTSLLGRHTGLAFWHWRISLTVLGALAVLTTWHLVTRRRHP